MKAISPLAEPVSGTSSPLQLPATPHAWLPEVRDPFEPPPQVRLVEARAPTAIVRSNVLARIADGTCLANRSSVAMFFIIRLQKFRAEVTVSIRKKAMG